MQLNEFIGKLNKVKGSGKQYTALCPAHSDNKQSLSVSVGDNGKILLNCHTGCTAKEIVNAMGLTMQDLFPELPRKTREKNTVIAKYNYTDKDGNLLNTKTRWSDKSFSWSHKENGKWKKGHKGEAVLYNLPAVVSSKRVYVMEGEKDVETLKTCQKVATCSAHGAGTGKWLPQYTEALKGKEIVIIQDNDDKGKEFARETANALIDVAESVKVIDLTQEWDTLKEHGDISDVFEMQEAKDVLTKLEALETMTSPQEQKYQEEIEQPSFYDGTKFLHNVMGDYLIQKFHVCKINNTIHIYDNGIYKQGEDILYGYMIKLVKELKDTQRKEVFKYIKVNLDTPEKEVSPPNLIPFKTKIYNVDTKEFLQYDPEYVFLNRFPYDYKPNAKNEPLVIETIASIANHNQEAIDLLYEAMGNCFYLLNSYRGAVMLYGKSGNNGKSTLLNMIIKLLGRENTSALSLQDTCEKFRLYDIYGKVANIGDDIPNTYFPDSSIFKKLVTGESVIAEQKQKDPITFEPFAKLFFAMNGLPTISDKSKAFFSRILLIPLEKDFSKLNNMNVDLKNRNWTDSEMECLTRLAMEGFERLRKNGDFTRPQVVMQALEEYERENNPVREFVEEYTERNGQLDKKPIETVYGDYILWSDRSGHRNKLTRYRFTKEVCTQFGMRSESIRHEYFNGRTGRCFVTSATNM